MDGVLCWDELKMENTAPVAERLGLPGARPDVIDRCRDKHRTRTALDAAGVPQPRSIPVDSPTAAALAANRIGYPVVLKPRALGASMGVTRVDTPAELAAAYAHTRAQHVSQARHYDFGVLVEAYADGPEFSVDSAVVDGVVTPLFLARKTSGFPPYFEEERHVVDGTDPLLDDPELRHVLRAAHEALEFDSGMTHIELRHTPGRGWSVIEVDCRLGGDLIPFLGLRATGIDAGQVAAAVAWDVTAQLTADPAGSATVAAIRFFYPTPPWWPARCGSTSRCCHRALSSPRHWSRRAPRWHHRPAGMSGAGTRWSPSPGTRSRSVSPCWTAQPPRCHWCRAERLSIDCYLLNI